MARPLLDTLHMLSYYHQLVNFARTFYKKPKKKKRNMDIFLSVKNKPYFIVIQSDV